jgi:hypothetical protein
MMIRVAINSMKPLTVAVTDSLNRPVFGFDVKIAAGTNGHPSNVCADFLAFCHNRFDNIACLKALDDTLTSGSGAGKAVLIHMFNDKP